MLVTSQVSGRISDARRKAAADRSRNSVCMARLKIRLTIETTHPPTDSHRIFRLLLAFMPPFYKLAS